MGMPGHAKGMVDCGARVFRKRCQQRRIADDGTKHICGSEATFERHTHCPKCNYGPINFFCEMQAMPGFRCPIHDGLEHWAEVAGHPAELIATLIGSSRLREVWAEIYNAGSESGRASPVEASWLAVAVLQATMLDQQERKSKLETDLEKLTTPESRATALGLIADVDDRIVDTASRLSRAARENAHTRRQMWELNRGAVGNQPTTIQHVVGDPRETPDGAGIRELPPANIATDLVAASGSVAGGHDVTGTGVDGGAGSGKDP